MSDSPGGIYFSGSLDSRLQVNRSHDVMPSIFDPISSHIPLKLKEKAWKGDFIDFHLLIKICMELANEQGIEGDLAVKGVSLAVVNKTSNPIRNIYVWSSAFMVYASVMLEKWPNKGIAFFKYMHSQNGSFKGLPSRLG